MKTIEIDGVPRAALKIDELGKLVGCTGRHVWDLVAAGEIKVSRLSPRVVRVTVDEFEKLLKSKTK